MRRKSEDGPPRLAWGMYKRFVLAGVIITSLCAATIASAVLLEIDTGIAIFKRNTTPIDPQVKALLADVAPGKPQTILVIGDDRRKAEALRKHPPPTRSDTMILVRLDPHQRATALMSLPRDLLVDIPGHGRQKLNAAFAFGEDRLTLRTVRDLLGIPIHHYVRVTFWGFRGAVDRLGCVYVDVDHKYFNDNSPPNGGGGPYAVINVPAGYQRLCGEDALSYVRYRHLDNDLIRAARQQSFLGEAKNQIGIGSVFSDRKELLRIFGQSVRTDIDSRNAILSLLRLVAESADKPIQEVQFPAQDAGDGSGNVVIGPTALKRTVASFLAARATTGPRGTAKSTTAKRSKRSRKRQSNAVAWPGPQPQREREHRRAAAGQARPPAGLLPDADVCDRQLPGRRLARLRHRRPGQQAPPRLPDRRLRRPDRAVLRSPGHRLALAPDPRQPERERDARAGASSSSSTTAAASSWSPGERAAARYWISNTLLRTLTNKQMLALARSTRTLGGR